MEKEYYLGLDMGTNSVGWAVTDRDYKILRAKGKDLWGVREFEEASLATERRAKRVARRRYQREKVRLGMIKSYFADAIESIDPYFFVRLDNSFYIKEDKDDRVKCKNILFDDDTYCDADYFKEYPTVFHLRKELMDNPNAHDVRLIYLAIANMFKHRGHFLNDGLSSNDFDNNKSELIKSYINIISDICEVSLIDDIEATDVFKILGDKIYSRTQKKEELIKIFELDAKKDKEKIPFLMLICGLSVKIGDLFPEIEFEDNKYGICFNIASYDEKIPDIIEKVGEDRYMLIENAKSIYDVGILTGILGNYRYLSDARVASYEKHEKDLKILKRVLRPYPDKYDFMFRSENNGSYGAYVKSVNTDGNHSRRGSESKSRKQEDLYRSIKNILKTINEDENVTYILNEIEKENFLPKQLTSANGTIPNQVHLIELKKILENASGYLNFLNEKDASGLTVMERIISLFSFQIPYFVGPTSSKSAQNGGNGWVIRKEEGKVLPWNIEEKINLEETQVEFIRRLVRECTYLSGEKVMPKASLLYEKFCVLNEINNIRIDGNPITVELKQEIFKDKFLKGKKVTRKALESYLIMRKIIKDGSQLSGIDISVNSSLSSYAKFYSIFGEEMCKDKYFAMAEDIIFLSTVYGDSKVMLKDILKRKYSDVIGEQELNKIIGFKFRDWGRLSKEFLELQGCNKTTGEILSIITALWETNLNLMELINSVEYTFSEALNEKKTALVSSLSEFTFDKLDEMYFSAPVKRMIWQTSLVIREIENAMGCAPSRIFVEMTRNDDEKKRSVSRKDELLELFKKESREWKDLIIDADGNGSLRSKKLYLYIKQMGKCMYTGEQINLDQLFDNNLYDIDHIYPRSKVKDDNINNNLVLVKKQVNASKTDNYPLDEGIYRKMKDFWKILWMKKMINDEKYKRLTCRKPFTEEQLSGFIARQLVETSQGTKGIAELIKQLMPETLVVYSKASNVSEFRKRIGRLKSRSINEYHHAHDAYLNIVVGNVYFVKFTQNPRRFISSEHIGAGTNYHLYKMFDWDVIRGNDIAWVAQKKDGNPGTVATVKRMLDKNTPIITRRVHEGRGSISNETLYSARVARTDNYVPIKRTDTRLCNVERYGGFTSLNPAYFIFIEHGSQKKRKKCFDVIPLYYSDRIKNNDDIKNYCENVLEYENVRVICGKIQKNALFRLDGYYLYITGLDNRKNVEFFNATSMIIGNEYMQYIHELESSRSKGYLSDKITLERNINLYEELSRKHRSNIFANGPKPIFDILVDGKTKFLELPLEKQADVLLRIISLTSIGRTNVSLSEIGGPSENGRIRISGNMTGKSELLLINNSPAGLSTTVIDLLKA